MKNLDKDYTYENKCFVFPFRRFCVYYAIIKVLYLQGGGNTRAIFLALVAKC